MQWVVVSPGCHSAWLRCHVRAVQRLDLVARILLFDQCLKHSLGVIQPAIAFASGVEGLRLIQDTVGLDALPLDVPSARGDVTRHRDSQTAAIAQAIKDKAAAIETFQEDN